MQWVNSITSTLCLHEEQDIAVFAEHMTKLSEHLCTLSLRSLFLAPELYQILLCPGTAPASGTAALICVTSLADSDPIW